MPTPSTLSLRLAAVQGSGGFPAPTLAAFGDYLESATEAELFRMSPLRYAETQGVAEQEAIDLFLHATHAGILDLRWGVLCPGCAAFLTTPGGLAALRQGRRCGFCQLDVKGLVDDNVEVAFTVAPAVRRIRHHSPGALDPRSDGFAVFFSSSLPGDSSLHRHLRDTLILTTRAPAGAVHDVQADLPAGRYLLVEPAGHGVLRFETRTTAGAQGLEVDVLDGRLIAAQAALAAGPVTLRLNNRCRTAVGLLLLPDPLPPPEARPAELPPPAFVMRPFLTGKRLITTQAFRDLFRAESIPSEGGLELRNLTVLFTDLKGSTEMYERMGDLRAYDVVRQHFALLRDSVVHEGGAVVKTIGDAVMASFAEPPLALRAAVSMQRGVRAGAGGEDLHLKIGLHAGPCIAVELNERLDYFGRTVNLAARVQGLAAADEIVCTEAVRTAPGVEAVIRAAQLRVEPANVNVKGLAGQVPVVRLRAEAGLRGA